MKLAFLYAGQGSQAVGMGKDFCEQSPIFRNTFNLLPKNLRELCFHGPIEALSQTENTQPCMVAFAVAVTEELRQMGIVPTMVAGLSLGEYSALHAAGVLSAQTAIELVTFRGQQMANAVSGLPCKMMAVLALDQEALLDCCKQASVHGVVEITNYNCPGQLVIGGEATAVEAAAQLALERGARRCLPLAVSGPFHTSLMRPAGDALREKFMEVQFDAPNIPVIFNCTAKPLDAREGIPSLLERQVQSSVRFEETVRYMQGQGVDTIVEIGPGKVLSGFVKKISKTINMLHVEDVPSLIKTVDTLRGVLV